MTENIDAKKATENAKEFLKDYHDSFSLISTILEESTWNIMCDVGFLNEEIKEVKVDAASGKILRLINVPKN